MCRFNATPTIVNIKRCYVFVWNGGHQNMRSLANIGFLLFSVLFFFFLFLFSSLFYHWKNSHKKVQKSNSVLQKRGIHYYLLYKQIHRGPHKVYLLPSNTKNAIDLDIPEAAAAPVHCTSNDSTNIVVLKLCLSISQISSWLLHNWLIIIFN